MSVTIFMGHRGSGKTTYVKTLVRALHDYGRSAVGYDLDTEIEVRTGRSVADIFKQEGEAAFRKLEEKVLTEIFGQYDNSTISVFLSMGAGYQGALPDPAHLIWLQRVTDREGRIFLDRPRLRPNLPPLQESKDLFQERNLKFSRTSDETLIRPEGAFEFEEFDRIFFQLQNSRLGGGITLLPKHFKRFASWGTYVEKRIQWGVDFFELRDDLLDERMIRLALQELEPQHLLLSFRSAQTSLFHQLDLTPFTWDWPHERGRCPLGNPRVLSLHTREEDFYKQLKEFQGYRSHLKLALEVHTWDELNEGHHWWMRDPSNRSFLPRSKDGRWRWYRNLFGHYMRVSFFREDEGSSKDQPLFAEWVRGRREWEKFAAVLGSPVHHSRTPSEHLEFFGRRNIPVVPIDIKEDEFSEALEILKEMGLVAAAVTSPLKALAYRHCTFRTEPADRDHSVNTLFHVGSGWQGHSTDAYGFKKAISPRLQGPVVVWGGGGLKDLLNNELLGATFYEARKGVEGEGCESPY
ncbi:MAG: hypothetical protein KDD22_04665, partial [Bdellovibrionales bacterium]|nr:hypothetical protein [Bdellovibrionales bacterium]